MQTSPARAVGYTSSHTAAKRCFPRASKKRWHEHATHPRSLSPGKPQSCECHRRCRLGQVAPTFALCLYWQALQSQVRTVVAPIECTVRSVVAPIEGTGFLRPPSHPHRPQTKLFQEQRRYRRFPAAAAPYRSPSDNGLFDSTRLFRNPREGRQCMHPYTRRTRCAHGRSGKSLCWFWVGIRQISHRTCSPTRALCQPSGVR